MQKILPNLLKGGTQPIILALARGLKERIELELREALYKNRLLLISLFGEDVKRVTSETANRRNYLMAELADEISVAYALPGGNIEKLITNMSRTGKKFQLLNHVKKET